MKKIFYADNLYPGSKIFLEEKMKKPWLFFNLILCSSLFADNIGEKVNYILNNAKDRTSSLIEEGEALIEIKEFLHDEELGPAYIVSIDYKFDITFVGYKEGNIGLLIPELMFQENFYYNLKEASSMDMGSFVIDYAGMTESFDAYENLYEECFIAHIHDIDVSKYMPIMDEKLIKILWHKSSKDFLKVKDLEITLKAHSSVPVLGGVQIDISGKAFGYKFKAGFDLKPN
jgi:hypothetical protein